MKKIKSKYSKKEIEEHKKNAIRVPKNIKLKVPSIAFEGIWWIHSFG